MNKIFPKTVNRINFFKLEYGFSELGRKIVNNWENLDQEMEDSYWVKFWTCSTCWALRTSIIVGGILLYMGTPLFLIGVMILSAYYISDKL